MREMSEWSEHRPSLIIKERALQLAYRTKMETRSKQLTRLIVQRYQSFL